MCATGMNIFFLVQESRILSPASTVSFNFVFQLPFPSRPFKKVEVSKKKKILKHFFFHQVIKKSSEACKVNKQEIRPRLLAQANSQQSKVCERKLTRLIWACFARVWKRNYLSTRKGRARLSQFCSAKRKIQCVGC